LSITAKLDLSKKRSYDKERLTGKDPLKLLNQVIQTAFEVEPIKFKLANCESTNTITRKETIYLCREYLKNLTEQLKDKRKINQIVLYELMKEAGYILLNRWEYPRVNHRNVKDEFATALLLMFGQREAMETQVKYSPLLEPGSEERTDNIRKWLNDPYFVKKWQPFLTPKMQTSYLRLLKKKRPPWTSRKLIDRELIRRE
jgi:hypothetical protein